MANKYYQKKRKTLKKAPERYQNLPKQVKKQKKASERYQKLIERKKEKKYIIRIFLKNKSKS